MNVPASLHPGDLAGKLYEDGRDQFPWFLAIQASSVPTKATPDDHPMGGTG